MVRALIAADIGLCPAFRTPAAHQTPRTTAFLVLTVLSVALLLSAIFLAEATYLFLCIATSFRPTVDRVPLFPPTRSLPLLFSRASNPLGSFAHERGLRRTGVPPTVTSSRPAPTTNFQPSEMALPKRIIKETERLLAEP
jgi:hypothetical protein